jgi:hypothetical protein
MPEITAVKQGPCNPACTRVVKFLTDHEVPPNIGISVPPYSDIGGYRYINIFVQFSQKESGEPPVNLGVVFAFDKNGHMGARRYVNLEANLAGSQNTNFIDVSGAGTWHGNPHDISTYVARFPVMGPFVEVFVHNLAPIPRTVSVWGYLVS